MESSSESAGAEDRAHNNRDLRLGKRLAISSTVSSKTGCGVGSPMVARRRRTTQLSFSDPARVLDVSPLERRGESKAMRAAKV